MMAKILTLIAIVGAVLAAFRLIGQLKRLREERARRAGEEVDQTKRGRKKIAAEDMVRCAVCDAYVAAGAGKCGKPGCPQ